MSYQTGTTHYNLPQTVGTDKRDWFDTNQAFADVDAALYGVVQQSATDHSDIVTMKGDISDLKAADTQFGLDLAETNGRVTTLEQHEGDDAEAIQDLADMFCPLEEAAAEADVAVANGRMFRYNGVLYRATADIAIGDTIVPNTNCVATNMENELDNGGATVTAAEVTYDNTSSGLTADDVQEAIDEINTSLAHKGNVRYYNGNLQQYNGSTWVNVQIGGSMPTLNYSNPLHNFTSGNLTFTATKECYLTGTVVAGSAITGNINNANIIYNGSSGVTGFIPPIKIMSGDVVTVSAACANLYVFDVVS